MIFMIFMASMKNRGGTVVFSYVEGKFPPSSQILSNHFKGIQDAKEMCRVESITKKNQICLFFNLTRICLT